MQPVDEARRDLERDYADLLTPAYPAFSDAEMARRDRLVGEMIAQHGLDALIVAEALRAGSATGWLTGWPVTAEAVTAIVPGAPRRMFVQHFNHLPLARQIARNTEMSWGAQSSIAQAMAAVRARAPAARRVGLIGRLTPTQGGEMAATFQLVDINRAYAQARLIKSQEEIRWLSLAAALTDLAVLSLTEHARPGVSERELHALIQQSYLCYGGTNFIHYLLSTPMDAPDTAVPRQFASNRKLATGDVLAAELSVDFWGYTGQILRTFFIGRAPNDLYARLHAAADAAYDAILARIRPGVHVRELVKASRLIEDAGFTVIDDLVHGYGGGYLPPVLGTQSRPAAGGVPDMTLAAGMTLVVQPNVVTADRRAGVQTGQLVVVTEEGARSLQRFPRGYHVL